ncbi:dctp deaminase [Anaeramoeba flamelloides]|uniref:Dctp deaminase n=1 Tax=Anaeramoeba flamelloides TaxID=1746091 RepID=A0AAV7ZY84_9EUKA|nr:dctp deaminase [Anaeramoeba flamelloides]
MDTSMMTFDSKLVLIFSFATFCFWIFLAIKSLLKKKNSNGCVLTGKEIKKAISKGEIGITSKKEKVDLGSLIGCASIDLTLGTEFRKYTKNKKPIEIREKTNYQDFTELITLSDKKPYLEIAPHESCLGITEESVYVSKNLSGLISGRSRFARVGLFVHFCANFIQPGIEAQQVLEIFNASNHPLRLYPGEKVCQVVFLKMFGEGVNYNGKFYKQKL